MPLTFRGHRSNVGFESFYCFSLIQELHRLQALQNLDSSRLKSEGSTHGIIGDKGLEESSYCPQRTRWVSRGGQQAGMLQGDQREGGLRTGHWTWPLKKMTDFRAHSTGGSEEGGLRSRKCALDVDSSKEADRKDKEMPFCPSPLIFCHLTFASIANFPLALILQ